MLKNYYTILFSFGFICSNAHEISLEPGHVNWSIYGTVAIPSDELKEAVDNTVAVGFGSNVLFNVGGKTKISPLAFGLDFSYVTYGREKVEATSSSPPYKTTFNDYAINGVSRVLLSNRTGGFTPFLKGTLGLRIFNTRTKIDKDAIDYIMNGSQPEVIHNRLPLQPWF